LLSTLRIAPFPNEVVAEPTYFLDTVVIPGIELYPNPALVTFMFAIAPRAPAEVVV